LYHKRSQAPGTVNEYGNVNYALSAQAFQLTNLKPIGAGTNVVEFTRHVSIDRVAVGEEYIWHKQVRNFGEAPGWVWLQKAKWALWIRGSKSDPLTQNSTSCLLIQRLVNNRNARLPH
jgi:hypothetical protein